MMNKSDHFNNQNGIDKKLSKLKEKWLKKWFIDKEISKTEMYFINKLEDQFSIKYIRAKVILEYLIHEEIKELYSFVKNKQSYTLSKLENKFLINTPHIWFEVDSKEEIILNFMKQELKQIN